MKEMMRELFLENWVKEASLEEIVQKLIENDERHKEIERLNNIVNELEKWLKEEKENYNLELTKKNEKALSYSLPIKNVYRQVLDKIKELEDSGSDE
jgi:hypothetical protein